MNKIIEEIKMIDPNATDEVIEKHMPKIKEIANEYNITEKEVFEQVKCNIKYLGFAQSVNLANCHFAFVTAAGDVNES